MVRRFFRKKRAPKRRSPFRRFKRRNFRKSTRVTGRVLNYADRTENQIHRPYINRPFPRIKRMVFSYTHNQALATAGSGSVLFGTAVGFYLNSLYSPNISGGHQPYGYDQIVGGTMPYSRYKVNGVRVKLTFFGLRGGDSEADLRAAWGGVLVNNANSAVSIGGQDFNYMQEMPQSQIVKINSDGQQHGVIDLYFPMYKMFNWGKKDYQKEQENTTAPYNGSPASLIRMYIAIICNSGPTAAVSAYCKVDIKFYAELYARNLFAQS